MRTWCVASTPLRSGREMSITTTCGRRTAASSTAATDLEVADRRRQETEQLKKQWMQRHPHETVGGRILNRFLRLLSGLM